eukprot:TRINITY_DN507_c0_g1_i5.p1 TRINITY_DN507_c0_g1~~TRINITY_DN507_c0_g1_i5.p1  ORF type:complete len:320 (+),score=109.17 TRINITY_DN507_c0_g1_i5:31-960(+)
MQQASLARLLTTYDDSSVAAAQAAAATDVSSALAIVDYGEDEDDDGDGDGYDESGTDEAAPPANAAEVEGEDAPASAVQHHLRLPSDARLSFLSPSPPPTPALPQLPQEPTTDADKRLVAKLEKYWTLRRQGTSINASLRQSQAFNNPDILEKLIDFVGIDEIGSNYPTDIFNPHGFEECDFYDGLVRRHAEDEAARIAAARTRTTIEFQPETTTAAPAAAAVSAAAAPTTADGSATATAAVAETRSATEAAAKPPSKWDQTGDGLPAADATAAVVTAPSSVDSYADFVRNKKREAELAAESAAKRQRV